MFRLVDLEEGIHKRSEYRSRTKDNQSPQDQENHYEGYKPPLLLLFEEFEKLFEQLPHAICWGVTMCPPTG